MESLKGTLPPPQLTSSLLLGIAVVAALLALGFLLWFVGQAVAKVIDVVASRQRIPRARTTYLVFAILCGAFLILASASVSAARLLHSHTRVTGPTRLGEVRCDSLAKGNVRTTFSAAPPTTPVIETAEEPAASCRIEVAVVTLRGLPARFGIGSLARITQIGNKSVPSNDPEWWTPQLGFFPLRLLVRESVNVQASSAPDGIPLSAVVDTPPGLILRPGG